MATHSIDRVPKGEQTRAKILSAAEVLFAERGLDATTFAAIAERVGIQQPAIYYYYPNKERLYEDVVEDAIGSIEEEMLEVYESSKPPKARMLTAVETWVDVVAARPTLAMLILREVATPRGVSTSAKVTEVGARVFGAILEALAATLTKPLDRIDALHFSSCMSGSTLFFVAGNAKLLGEKPTLRDEAMERHKELLRATAEMLIRRLGK